MATQIKFSTTHCLGSNGLDKYYYNHVPVAIAAPAILALIDQTLSLLQTNNSHFGKLCHVGVQLLP